MLCLLSVNVCVSVNTPGESLHSNFSILQDETQRKWSLIQEKQMFTELITDHTDTQDCTGWLFLTRSGS